MNRYIAILSLAALGLGALSPAHGATRAEQKKACSGDALRLCSADIPNESKITDCMKQHVNELSPQCKVMFRHGKS